LRVSARALDGLSRQVDQLQLLHGGEARRATELSHLALAVGEALRSCERAARAPEPRLRAAVVELQTQLRQLKRDGVRVSREARRSAEKMQLAGGSLREQLVDLVMMPASVMLEPLRRAVHDVARRLDKPVELVLEGGDVRLDRRVIDELKDPLLHLVRNAVDHGLEAKARREALGKPLAGRLRVRVEPRGPRATVLVEDDGGGLDLERVRAVALERGLVDAPALSRLSEDEVARLIFAPGFSTAQEVSTISGRGIGLDVVADTVRRLHGTVELQSRPKEGTSFLIDVPLTLAARAGLLVSVSGETCAVPIDGIRQVLRLRREQLGSIAGRVMATIGGRLVPYAHLADVIGLAGRVRAFAEDGVQRALLLHSGSTEVAVAVDGILGEQALIVQPLGPHAGRIAHLEGAAVLTKGGVVPVLDVGGVVQQARPAPHAAAPPRHARVLVADDSLTTRSAMKLLLELAGYQVVTASNGSEALALLRDSPCDLVVSDVEMPVVDGLGLTRHIKGDAALAKTPVVLVTSLSRPEDRALGLQAGADGYVVKREVENGKLLDLVRQLLPEAPRFE
jgi:two-component system chemotaxis sensor kinase CheA